METLQAGVVAAAVQAQLQRHPRMRFYFEAAQSLVPLAFAEAGLPMPQRIIITGSLNMRQNMLARGRFVTCVPHSMLPFAQLRGKFHILPIQLPLWQTPTMVLKLQGRNLGPAAEAFLYTLRELSRPLRMAASSRPDRNGVRRRSPGSRG